MSKGKVYIVGAGPGDPGLLTLRAQKVLSEADVVIYDALIHSRVLGFIPEKAKKIFRGNRNKKGALSQFQINTLLVSLARMGKNIVRLKGGDPFVFGRGAEEALELRRHKIDFEIVPGVSSAIAVPAYAGIPVTHRALNSSFTVVTGHEDPTKPEAQIDWESLALNEGTLVFLMGLHTLKGVCERLIQEGKSVETPVAVIQSGTTPQQKVVVASLADISERVKREKLKAPATVIVGKVVRLMDKLQWLKPDPLTGVRVLLTRTRDQSSYLSGLLGDRGAEVIELPTIEIAPLPISSKARGWLLKIQEYDWVIFSSVNTVEIFMKNLFDLKKDVRDLSGVKIACVGGTTAKRLKDFGVSADLVPADYKQEGLVKSFGRISCKGKRVLFARAKEGRNVLVDFLKKEKALVDFWPLYENRIPSGLKKKALGLFANEGGVDLLTFASSSSVDHFFALFSAAQRRKWLLSLPVAVIGPVTGASARKWGCRVILQPRKYTMPDLVSAIVKWGKKHKGLKS